MANVTTQPRTLCSQPSSYGNNMKPGMFCAGPFEGGIDSCQVKKVIHAPSSIFFNTFLFSAGG